MRDLRSDELTHIYGAGGIGKLCFTLPICAPKASKSKKTKAKSCKAKASKSKKGWC